MTFIPRDKKSDGTGKEKIWKRKWEKEQNRNETERNGNERITVLYIEFFLAHISTNEVKKNKVDFIQGTYRIKYYYLNLLPKHLEFV